MRGEKLVAAMLVLMAVLLAACGGKRQDPADLQHKIDSVMALDNLERLRLQGIRVAEENPLKAFYDSLLLQPLPVVCDEEYATTLPRFVSVPDYVADVLEVSGEQAPLAIALPESFGAKLILIALSQGYEGYSLWLYSLDDSYAPVDKLKIYSPLPVTLGTEKKPVSDCIISRDYEIIVREFLSVSKTNQQVYHVGDGRTFIKQ